MAKNTAYRMARKIKRASYRVRFFTVTKPIGGDRIANFYHQHPLNTLEDAYKVALAPFRNKGAFPVVPAIGLFMGVEILQDGTNRVYPVHTAAIGD